ncbi:hypothetical protein tb265_26340 [Gemmatimonadetes bacterium T265]|nr:hypothetical protein tb265_26340 [Gemmatimonadetes bacterium T265]
MRAAACLLAALVPACLTSQTLARDSVDRAGASPAGATAIVATHAATPPVIDGRDDDPVWRAARPVTDFVQWRPTEDKPPRFRTEARVAYDAANLYVFVRAFDPHPDSIIRILERRDTFTPSDMIWLFVDSYHDHRTGYEFGVNAAGVKMDQAIYDDGREDQAWDGVWEVATRIDSLGWAAEFRIPLSQLRYGRAREHTFGLTIDRDIYRYQERVSWPIIRQSRPGFVSQFGELRGLVDLETPRRFEAVPYLVARAANQLRDNRFTTTPGASVGGDFRWRVASNVVLDGTVNPDFGQVESDPAVLNLSAYETFFDERRPFFVAGRGLFRFDVNCNAVNCEGEGLYYSRRIGRTPQLAGTYGDTVPQQPTTILGAEKLIGTWANGLSFGVLDATTKRAAGPADTTYEPLTNYALARVRQDFRQGASSIGAILTAVNRGHDRYAAPYLTSGAYAGAVDARHRFWHDVFEVSGSLDRSLVTGSRAAIAAVQSDAVHYFQRPDARFGYDTTRTSLTGDAEELRLAKVSGLHLNAETSYQRRSAGFEVNDLGYLRRADEQSWNTWAGFADRHARGLYNSFRWNNNWWQYWTTAGLPLERAYNTNVHVTLRNNWGVHTGGTLGQIGTTFDDRAARGGPAVRQDPYLSPWLSVGGDDRRALVPYWNMNAFRGSGGRHRQWNVGPELDGKFGGRFSSALSVNYSRNVDDAQWYGNYADSAGATHYTFAHLAQSTTSATLRMNYTFTPTVSLQVYAQPFMSKGTYSDVRQLSATPRAAAYAARYAPYANPPVTADPGGFDFRELQSNVVFRWEYAPGSTLFLVWNEGRLGNAQTEGSTTFGGDVRGLLRLHPANTVLVKLSYYLNR